MKGFIFETMMTAQLSQTKPKQICQLVQGFFVSFPVKSELNHLSCSIQHQNFTKDGSSVICCQTWKIFANNLELFIYFLNISGGEDFNIFRKKREWLLNYLLTLAWKISLHKHDHNEKYFNRFWRFFRKRICQWRITTGVWGGGAKRAAAPIGLKIFRANSVFRASTSCSKTQKYKKYFYKVKNFRATLFF